MKANTNTGLVGLQVALVPYRPQHVPNYHRWMLNEELRELTASEPLTLEEEYHMQEKWQLDEDKLTFIILARQPNDDLQMGFFDLSINARGASSLSRLPMVGDVNVFLYGPLSILHNERFEGLDADDDAYAEVEVMIAEPSFRRKGLALEALQLMLSYVTGTPFGNNTLVDTHLPLEVHPSRLVARISEKNESSIALFQKLGFSITKRVEVFGEVEMKKVAIIGSTITS